MPSKKKQTAVRTVLESKKTSANTGANKGAPTGGKGPGGPGKPTPQTPQPKVQPKADPKLRVGPLADFDWGSKNVAAAVKAVVQHLGDGVLSFEPALDTLGAAGEVKLTVKLAESKSFLPAQGALSFRIRKADPKLKVGAMPTIEYDPNFDGAAALKKLATFEGDGVLGFVHDQAKLGEPGKVTLKISLAEGSNHKAAGPLDRTFEIIKRDPQFKLLGQVADFDYDAQLDVADLVRKAVQVQHEGKGVVSFEPPLETLGKPQKVQLAIRLSEGSHHKAAGPAFLDFEIRKLVPSITLPVFASHVRNADFGMDKKYFTKPFDALRSKLPASQGYGALKIVPAPESLVYDSGDYSIELWLEEGPIYLRSKAEFVKFSVHKPSHELITIFNKWWETEKPTTMGKLNAARDLYCGTPGKPPPTSYSSEASFIEALNLAAARLPKKSEIWAALGYGTMSNASSWLMETKPVSSRGTPMHLTISFGNIATPTTNIWAESNQSIFDKLFRGANIKTAMRVHMSLELNTHNVHVFVGNGNYVNGDGVVRQDSDFNGQVGEMIQHLKDFETLMLGRIGAAKAELAKPR